MGGAAGPVRCWCSSGVVWCGWWFSLQGIRWCVWRRRKVGEAKRPQSQHPIMHSSPHRLQGVGGEFGEQQQAQQHQEQQAHHNQQQQAQQQQASLGGVLDLLGAGFSAREWGWGCLVKECGRVGARVG